MNTEMIHCLTIPNWIPARLNELMKNRWKAYSLKRADKKIVDVYSRMQWIPKATGKRRVTLEINFGPGRYAGDPDCYNKSLLDALVASGLLKTDTYNGVEIMPPIYRRSEKTSTTIILEDI